MGVFCQLCVVHTKLNYFTPLQELIHYAQEHNFGYDISRKDIEPKSLNMVLEFVQHHGHQKSWVSYKAS